MRYKIEITEEYLSRGISRLFNITENGRSVNPDNPIQNFVSIEIRSHPLFLSHVLLGNDYSQIEYSWILFGECRDANDEAKVTVPETMVGFAVFEDVVLMNKHMFFELCLEFANKSLIAADIFGLKEKGVVGENWLTEIQELIPLIEGKAKSII